MTEMTTDPVVQNIENLLARGSVSGGGIRGDVLLVRTLLQSTKAAVDGLVVPVEVTPESAVLIAQALGTLLVPLIDTITDQVLNQMSVRLAQ